MYRINDEQKRIIIALKAYRVFQNIDEEELSNVLCKGIILVMCGDGWRFYDVIQHLLRPLTKEKQFALVHPVVIGGGAPRMARDSRMNKAGHTTAVDMVEDIVFAQKHRHLNAALFFAHAPCGKAAEAKMSIFELIDALFDAETRLKRRARRLSVKCFFHVDFGNGKMRSYFVSKKTWEESRGALLADFRSRSN